MVKKEKKFSPMLAVRDMDLEKLEYPCLASPKLDGIRCIIKNGAKSRKLKTIPNGFVTEHLGLLALEGMDGELVVGSPTAKGCFNRTQSGVMSDDGNPKFTYLVFDLFDRATSGFVSRLAELNRIVKRLNLPYVQVVEHTLIPDRKHLDAFEEKCLAEGYEGIIVRGMTQSYKFGRSTAREQGMMKVKRFQDSEGVIISCEELLRNDNEQTRNELGKAKRSSHKANLTPMGTLGSIIYQDLKTKVISKIGSGWTAEQRQELWNRRQTLPGKIFKYKFFPYGVKNKPRHGIWLGFRHKDDM